MRVHLLILSIVVFIAARTHAQNAYGLRQSEISIGPEYAIPLGSFRAGNGNFNAPDGKYTYGLGGSAKYAVHINEMWGVSLQAGAIGYHGTGGLAGFTAFPVKLGGSFRYGDLFAEPQFGLSYFSNNNTVYQSGSTTYGITIGGYVTDHLVLSGNYERWNKGGFSASHVGIRMAYALFLRGDSTRKVRPIPSREINPDYRESVYWKKHRTFKTLGWTALGIGIPLTFVGLVATAASIENSRINRNTGYWLMGSGAVLTVSSVPFFILSHRYRKMAKRPVFY